ncbi:Type 1 glutamine amidotransferase-like domain-containing protein [Actinoplanes sp. URMC 104]|uniref:Type 1 glutamine amidotransferase-like domain-containing protein n=1 Tax=Actinoplanes sp. URMC 104 TaxID=3423409 RepID=UPI003F1A7F0A
MTIFLGGGGSEDDEALLWDEVFRTGGRVAVWPFAQPRRQWRAIEQWLAGALARRGNFAIDLPGDATGGPGELLETADVLVIPGGNTFDLLAALWKRDLVGALTDFAVRGGNVYGGSAGAILLGADIAIAGVLDRNDTGSSETRGLDLLGGHVVFPHFDPSAPSAAREWARTHDVPVLAIPETAGVVVDGAQARNAGPSPVEVFTPAGGRAYAPGEVWSLRGQDSGGAASSR